MVTYTVSVCECECMDVFFPNEMLFQEMDIRFGIRFLYLSSNCKVFFFHVFGRSAQVASVNV